MEIFSNKNPIIAKMAIENKLPSEDKMREYLDQFITTDTDALSQFMPSVDKLINKELKKSSHPGKLYNWHAPGKWPIDTVNAWIATSFGSDLDNCPKPQWQEVTSAETVTFVNPLPSYSGEFIKQLEKSKSDFSVSSYNKASRGSNLILPSRMNCVFNKYHTTQLNEFHTALRDKKYVQVRSEPELKQEILTRQAQYPKWKVYVLLGQRLIEYFGNIHKTHEWNGALLIETTSSFNGMNEYESAVFAESQVRASHEFHFHYSLERIPRWWKAHFASIMKFALEVDECIGEKKKIKEKPSLTMARFDNLE